MEFKSNSQKSWKKNHGDKTLFQFNSIKKGSLHENHVIKWHMTDSYKQQTNVCGN